MSRYHLHQPEVQAFLAQIDSPRDRALFRLMYWRGLRSCEPGLQIASRVR
jgi:hypothetical protein